MKISKRNKLTVSILAAMAACLSLFICSAAFAAAGSIKSFSLIDDAGSDIVGASAIGSDGVKDAGFSISLSGAGAVNRITLKDTTAGKTWDSQRGSDTMLAIKGGKNDEVLNGGAVSVIPFLLGTQLTLWVNDRDAVLAKDATFEVNVSFVDGSSDSKKLEIKGLSPDEEEEKEEEKKEDSKEAGPIVSAVYLGGKQLQLSGPASIGGRAVDMKSPKLVVETSIKGKGTITGFRLKNTAAPAGTWDTGMDKASQTLFVATDNSGELLNKSDGGVSIFIDGERGFRLLADENEALSNPKAETVLYVYMDGSRVFEMPIERPAPSGAFKSIEFLGRGTYDFVGKSAKPEPNLNPDYSIKLSPNMGGTLTGIKLSGSWQSSGKTANATWDTLPSSENSAIVATRTDGKPLNRLDGALSEKIETGEVITIWFDTDSDISKDYKFKVTMLFSDGKVIEGEATSATKK